MNEKLVLYNGVEIPKIGFGVYRMTDPKECEQAVLNAIQAGYRLIDTAAAYENEEAVGKAIKKSGVKREELFITTKLWVTDTSYEKAKAGFNRSLERLGVEYIDLYLIHQPYNDLYGAWRALEELYNERKIKAIGVDNFTEDRLADFIFFNQIKPMVNMIECNVYFQRENELKYLKEKNILMEAWSPLNAGKKSIFEEPILIEIAEKYHKTIPQIILRWLLERGIVPVVKSSNIDRIKENIDIFDFELTSEEMRMISTLDTGKSSSLRKTGEAVESFLKMVDKFNV